MFVIVLTQLKKSNFLENLPVVDSTSVVFSKGRSRHVVKPIGCKPQSQWL